MIEQVTCIHIDSINANEFPERKLKQPTKADARRRRQIERAATRKAAETADQAYAHRMRKQ